MKFLHAVGQRIRAQVRPASLVRPLLQEPAPLLMSALADDLDTSTRRRPRVTPGCLKVVYYEAWLSKKIRRRISRASRQRNRHG